METVAWLSTVQPSFKITAKTLSELIRLDISTTTVWRHHQEVAGQIEAELNQEEQTVPLLFLEQESEATGWISAHDPIESHASVSIDGLTVLVREEGYREVKMVSISEVAELKKSEMCDSDKACGEGVATYELGQGRQDGLKLERHSYRAVLGDKSAFVPALKAELARRRVRGVKNITAVNDGAEWIWDLVRSYLPSSRVEVLDWCHAMQNLAKASHAAWGEGTAESRAWLAQRETELWNGQRMQIEIALHDLPRRRKERGKAIRQVRGYFDQHWERIRYDCFRAERRPIGSGAVESAAKNVVEWRMKHGGQNWSRLGATRMLAALGELHSGRWSPAQRRFAKAA